MGQGRRVPYLDLMRVVSMIAVILLHVSAQNWSAAEAASPEWRLFNAVNSLFRWGAPVFVMISGALLLDRDYAPRELLGKLFRLGAAFLFWSVLYALAERAYADLSPAQFLFQIVSGHYHMWFLYMIAGLYLLMPFLRKITASRRLTEYFLLLALVFNFAVPQAIALLSLASPSLADGADAVLRKAYFHFPLGFVGFFVLGYYLRRRDISPKGRALLCGLGIAGFAATAAGTSLLSLRRGAPNDMLYTYFSLNVLAECAGVFVFFKYRRVGESPALTALSRSAFGVYLVHPLVMDFMKNVLGLDTLSFSPFLSVPVLAAAVFAVSCVLSFAVGRIPKLGGTVV